MLTPETLNALPGWVGVAFFLLYVCKTLVDLIKERGDKAETKDKTDKSESKDGATAKDVKDLALSIARLEVRVDHLEGMIERLDDRVADLLREFSPVKRGLSRDNA